MKNLPPSIDPSIENILNNFVQTLDNKNTHQSFTNFENLLHHTLRQLLAFTNTVPQPAQGATLQRWQLLAKVGATDLNLAKWFEAHLDALSILQELGISDIPEGLWAVWAAEGSPNPITFDNNTCSGIKMWCSGADKVDYGLMSYRDLNNQSRLLIVDMHQQGITINSNDWQAIGMQHTATSTVTFDQVKATSVGEGDDYLNRVGFWHGAAGVAACWYGATVQLAHYLLKGYQHKPHPFKAVYLGEVSTQLSVTRQYFYNLASVIDEAPRLSHELLIRQLRAQVEQTARIVLEKTGQALGAAPFCRNAHFARLSSDLPVFIRQSHAAFDWQAIGDLVVKQEVEWQL